MFNSTCDYIEWGLVSRLVFGAVGVFALALSSACTTAPPPEFAAGDGQTFYVSNEKMKRLAFIGAVPQAISCRQLSVGPKGHPEQTAEVTRKWVKSNKPSPKWMTTSGTKATFDAYDKQAKAKGMRLVSSDRYFDTKLKQLYYCGVWHGK